MNDHWWTMERDDKGYYMRCRECKKVVRDTTQPERGPCPGKK